MDQFVIKRLGTEDEFYQGTEMDRVTSKMRHSWGTQYPPRNVYGTAERAQKVVDTLQERGHATGEVAPFDEQRELSA